MAGAQTSSSETATAVGRDEVVRRSRCAATRARSFQEGGTIGTMNSKRWASGSTGVNCTVEKAPKGWPPTWFSVIGTTGFDRASGASYENYLAEVEKVNEKFAGKGSFKRFDPRGIRWQERAD